MKKMLAYTILCGHSPFRGGPGLAVQFPQTSAESDKRDLTDFVLRRTDE